MRAKPVFDGNNSTTADTTNDYFTATAGSVGTPAISGYAAEVIFACANALGNWTIGAQINLTCVLTAEDRS
jgi:phosphate/sulfate permease